MRRNFRNWNKHGFRHRWLRRIGRPPHLWVFPRDAVAQLPEQIVKVDVTRQPVLFVNDAVQRGPRQVIHSVVVE
jgi:hypothetical protein